jgi:hypothetical protein
MPGQKITDGCALVNEGASCLVLMISPAPGSALTWAETVALLMFRLWASSVVVYRRSSGKSDRSDECKLLGEVLVDGVADGGCPVRGAGLGEDPVDVALDRVGADVELGGDAGVGHASCHHRQDFCFPSGEAVG